MQAAAKRWISDDDGKPRTLGVEPDRVVVNVSTLSGRASVGIPHTSAARAGQTQATGALLPSLSADGQVAWYQTDNGSGVGWNAGLDLTVPLLAGGSGVAGTRAAAAELDRRASLGDGPALSAEVLDASVRSVAAGGGVQEARLQIRFSLEGARHQPFSCPSVLLRLPFSSPSPTVFSLFPSTTSFPFLLVGTTEFCARKICSQ